MSPGQKRKLRKLFRPSVDTLAGSCHATRLFFDKLEEFGLPGAMTYLRSCPGFSINRGKTLEKAILCHLKTLESSSETG